MAIDGISTLNGSAAVQPHPVNPKGQMGNAEFMRLLVEQLKQQDPNQPMDAREMITQLSQLSGVEKLNAIDKSLTQLRSDNASMMNTQTAGLVGRLVTADMSTVSFDPAGVGSGQYQLMGQAKAVNVQVRDADGKVVRTLDMGSQFLGPHVFQWDGRGDSGARVPPGKYHFEVSAADSNGASVATSTKMSGRVSEVSYVNGSPELVVGGARISIGDVNSIAQ
jgi:flagellar basal-body rod modification protein FlgD